jgi:hypothetical protein
MSEKSILEQALLQVQNLEEAVKQNAKGILASTMKQELSDLLKESMEEEDETEVPVAEQPEDEVTPDEEEDDMSDEDAEADDAEADDTENDTNLDNDETTDIEDTDVDAEVDTDVDTDVDAEDTSMDDFGTEDETSDEDVMDMTSASDDEVLKVFKAMKPEDGIVVKKDGNQVEFGTGEDDYIIKLDGEDSDSTHVEPDADNAGGPSDHDADNVDEEPIYEIELDEEEEETNDADDASQEEVSEEEEEDVKKIEATEAARTKSNPHGDKGGAERAGLKSKKMYKSGSGAINEEVENLKKQNAEYKKALVLFKDKLNEVAVFNANLAYATRLFTEHSTTKQEKLNILKRFDSVSSMNESKGLFTTIKAELGSKITVTEAVAEKISNNPSTSSSTEVLSEAKAYENPQFARIKSLMGKIK